MAVEIPDTPSDHADMPSPEHPVTPSDHADTPPEHPDTPSEYPDMPPDHSDVHDGFSGRTWPSKAVDRFIVGHLDGTYDLKQCCLLLGLFDENFANIDVDELQHFWSVIVPTTTQYSYWQVRTREDAKVQKILEEIKALMDDALEFFLAHHDDYKTV